MTRPFRRLPALGWPGIRPSRGVVAIGLGAVLALALIPVAVAQSRRPPQNDQQVAARLYNEGKYDDVVAMVQKLDSKDQALVTLMGRSLAARGKYQEAEAALRPAAERDPVGDAALELGLHYQRFARPEALPILRRIAATAATANTPQELARAARALRATGEAKQANEVYKEEMGIT